jgi:hypothetical protein
MRQQRQRRCLFGNIALELEQLSGPMRGLDGATEAPQYAVELRQGHERVALRGQIVVLIGRLQNGRGQASRRLDLATLEHLPGRVELVQHLDPTDPRTVKTRSTKTSKKGCNCPGATNTARQQDPFSPYLGIEENPATPPKRPTMIPDMRGDDE